MVELNLNSLSTFDLKANLSIVFSILYVFIAILMDLIELLFFQRPSHKLHY